MISARSNLKLCVILRDVERISIFETANMECVYLSLLAAIDN
jgi:hypothetical protein